MATGFSIRFNREVGLLAVLSLLTAALVIVPAPGRAADPEPDYLAYFEACPEHIIPGADFVDVPSGHTNAGDIDCIAYYGVTNGTAAEEYSPEKPVIREHMALLLVRLARLVGIDVPSAAESPFEDIGDLEEDSREAISQIYQLGITIGATATTYAPARNVTRGEMALFLQRLMDLMVPVADGRIAFGFTPDDVNDNDQDFDVGSPFLDLREVPHAVHEAVTHLYELGVASGVSGFAYAPDADMTRATMAEFMAAILDHSNLRPNGVLVQVAPTEGTDDFEILVMVSVRDDNFAPIEDTAVDWFYTDDPDGGLEADGTCDEAKILGSGDCVWDEDEDDATDLDGNVFQDFDATPGASMSIYAWVGRRDGQRFDQDTADSSTARAKSEREADSLGVQHDVPANAARIDGNGAWIVDLSRRASVEFVIQLLNDDGTRLQREGVPVFVEVDSRQIRVEAEDVTRGRPDPDLVTVGRGARADYAVVTDQEGSATFDLRAPKTDERLDTVTIEADCCMKRVHQIAWSDGESVLVAARPAFEPYQERDGNRIELKVEYDLVDQYGGTLRGTASRYTGRPDTDLYATVSYRLYHAPVLTGGGTYTVTATPDAAGTSSIIITRRSVTADVEIEIPPAYREGYEFLVAIDAQVFSDRDGDDTLDSNEVRYVDSGSIVWVVNNARNEEEFDRIQGHGFTTSPSLNLQEVELYTSSRRFRTFFTLWSYHASHRFQVNGEFVDVETFEKLWEEQVDGIDDLEIPLYSSGFSLIMIR
ncbi:MAG: S-layer homology domain-containing protein [bacterium]|nr:S-layer homology domain-containing protein [Acidimicrobiia bacterium]MCY4650771.1 S-layer homology domain-containing protein [bacterium]